LRSVDNWNKISLKPSLVRDKEYLLINKSLWLHLKDCFGGGPEIHIFVVDSKPDAEPITVTINDKGRLVSLKIKDDQFIKYAAELIQNRPEEVLVKYKNAQNTSELLMHNNGSPIEEYGIGCDTIVSVIKKPSAVLEESKDFILSEEEIIRQVSEMSLRDQNSLQQEVSRLDRHRPPNIIITEEMKTAQEDKLKTPSTGESTPIWKHKRFTTTSPISHYQYLANIIKEYISYIILEVG